MPCNGAVGAAWDQLGPAQGSPSLTPHNGPTAAPSEVSPMQKICKNKNNNKKETILDNFYSTVLAYTKFCSSAFRFLIKYLNVTKLDVFLVLKNN